jgi:hypothetical protein
MDQHLAFAVKRSGGLPSGNEQASSFLRFSDRLEIFNVTYLGSTEDAEPVPKFYWSLHNVCAALRMLTFRLQAVAALSISISKFGLSAAFTIINVGF